MKKISYILLLIGCLLLFSACGSKEFKSGSLEGYSYEEVDEVTNYIKIVTNKDKVVLIELYPDIAPLTVAHFQDLVQEKFYDNKIFHRVIAGFMIQTGSPDGTVYSSYGDTVKGEFKNNGVENNLKHEEGMLSMARSEDMDSASSQFFICVNSNDQIGYLDGNYAAFGKVIAGYDTIKEISEVGTDSNDLPLSIQSMKTVRFVNIKEINE